MATTKIAKPAVKSAQQMISERASVRKDLDGAWRPINESYPNSAALAA
jgi:hypothetical protein